MEQGSAEISISTNTLHAGVDSLTCKTLPSMNITKSDSKINHNIVPCGQDMATLSSLFTNCPVNKVLTKSSVTRHDSTCTTTVHSKVCSSTIPTLPISTSEPRAGFSATDPFNFNDRQCGHNHIGHSSDSSLKQSSSSCSSTSSKDLPGIVDSLADESQSGTDKQIHFSSTFSPNTSQQLHVPYGNINSEFGTTPATFLSFHNCFNHNCQSPVTMSHQSPPAVSNNMNFTYTYASMNNPVPHLGNSIVNNVVEYRPHMAATQKFSTLTMCGKPITTTSSSVATTSCTSVNDTQSTSAASHPNNIAIPQTTSVLNTLPKTALTSEGGVSPTEDIVIVPFGWKREIEHGAVVYYSPSEQRLYSIEQVMTYLMSSTTCKCGLECPLVANRVFNFQPKAQCEIWTPTIPNHLTNLCHHRKKIVAMVNMANMTYACPGSLQTPDINFGLIGSPNCKEKKRKQVRKSKKASPYDGVLVSQLLAQRDKLNKLAAYNSSNNMEVSMDILSKQADDLKAQEEIVNQQIAAIKQKLAETESTKKENDVKKTSRKRKKTSDSSELANSDNSPTAPPVTSSSTKQYTTPYPHGMSSPPMPGMMFPPNLYPGGMMAPGQVVPNHMAPNQMAMNQMVPNQLMANQLHMPMQNQMIPHIRMPQGMMHPGMPQGQIPFPPQGIHFRQVQNQGLQNGINPGMPPNMHMFPGQQFPAMRPMGFPTMGPHPGNMMMQGHPMQMYTPGPQHFPGPLSPGGQHIMSPVAYTGWPDQQTLKKTRGKKKKVPTATLR